MENNQPLQPAVEQTDIPPAVPETPVPHEVPKKSKANWIIGLLILGLLLLVGYLYYQNVQLSKELEMVMLNGAMVSNVSDDPLVPTSRPNGKVATPTPDPTAEWEVYTDDQYGYTVKHPPAWKVDHNQVPYDSQVVSGEKIGMTSLSNGSVKVDIYFEGEFDHGFSPWSLESQTNTQLDGKIAERVDFILSGGPNYWTVVSIDDFNNFRIEANYPKNQVELLDQILSTFEFTQ